MSLDPTLATEIEAIPVGHRMVAPVALAVALVNTAAASCKHAGRAEG